MTHTTQESSVLTIRALLERIRMRQMKRQTGWGLEGPEAEPLCPLPVGQAAWWPTQPAHQWVANTERTELPCRVFSDRIIRGGWRDSIPSLPLLAEAEPSAPHVCGLPGDPPQPWPVAHLSVQIYLHVIQCSWKDLPAAWGTPKIQPFSQEPVKVFITQQIVGKIVKLVLILLSQPSTTA